MNIATPTPVMPLSLTRDHAATRSTRSDLGTLPNTLKSELIKLSSLRANRAVLAMTALVGGVTSWAVATFVTDEVLVASQVFVYSTVLTAVFAAVTGLLLFTSEVQHGTLPGTLAAQPARWVIVTAKTLMAAARGLVLGAVGMSAGFAGALLGGLEVGDTSTMVAATSWGLVFTTLAAVLGLGVGMLGRHSSAAVSGLLVWWFVVENLLAFFVPASALRFLPFYAGNGMLTLDSDFATPEQIAVALSKFENALVFGGYATVALIAGAVLLYRRDSN
jgi:hypothetical protein